jgi:hypothetical protein
MKMSANIVSAFAAAGARAAMHKLYNKFRGFVSTAQMPPTQPAGIRS